MSDITEKLKQLKAVQPTESWLVASRSEVLSKAPVSVFVNNTYTDSVFGINFAFLFSRKLAISFAAFILVISGGFITVFAASGSLPGEPLYSLKMATEGVELAVSSEENKAEVEIRQVGKRVEELAKVSQNHSDVKQKEKVEKLLDEIDNKSNSVNNHLAKLNKDGGKKKAVAVAKIVNNQSEKYAEVIVKTNNDLPASIKNEVSQKAEKALASNEKTKFRSLMVMVEGKDEVGGEIITNEELKDKIQKEINIQVEKAVSAEKTGKVEIPNNQTGNTNIVLEEKTANTEISEPKITENSVEMETAAGNAKTKNDLLASAQESLSQNNLLQAAESIVAIKDFDLNIEEILIVSDEETVTNEILEEEGAVKGDIDEQEAITIEKEKESALVEEKDETETEPSTEEAQ